MWRFTQPPDIYSFWNWKFPLVHRCSNALFLVQSPHKCTTFTVYLCINSPPDHYFRFLRDKFKFIVLVTCELQSYTLFMNIVYKRPFQAYGKDPFVDWSILTVFFIVHKNEMSCSTNKMIHQRCLLVLKVNKLPWIFPM